MKTSTNVKLYRYFGIIMFCFINFVSCCCVNVTIAILMERSAQTDMPFMINRTIGLVNMVTEKAQEMVENSTNLNFIVRYADVPGCTDMKWGSLASEVYHTNEIHGIIGPGNQSPLFSVHILPPVKPHFGPSKTVLECLQAVLISALFLYLHVGKI